MEAFLQTEISQYKPKESMLQRSNARFMEAKKEKVRPAG